MRRLVSLALVSSVAAACNSGGGSGPSCTGDFLPGDLAISEIFANPAGDDTGKEWFEIYNAGSKTADLTGLLLLHSKTDGSGEKSHRMTQVKVAPGDYLVLGDTTQMLRPPHVDYGYGNDLGGLRNDAGRIALKCNDTIVDEVTYTAVTDGTSRGFTGVLPPDSIANDDVNQWCDATMEYEPGSKGSPGEVNEPCKPVGQPTMCSDNGTMRDLVPPAAGDLVISEIMADPAAAGDATAEWFEVTVLRAVDLNGLELGTAPPTVRTMVNDVKCLRYAAGSHVVFARSADSGMNGMLPKVDFTFSFGLTNSGGSIFVGAGGAVLDQVMYASSKSGVAASLDPAKTTAAANDDPLNFCSATTTYGAGDKGTPGAANPSCGAIVQEGKCNDGGTMRDVAAPKAGDLVINEIMADPNAVSDAAGEWFEVYVNANVDLNGVTIGADATTVKDTLASADCLKAQMGSYLVFAHSDDSSMNGGLPHVDYVMTFGLTNSAGHTLALGRGGALLDLASYPAAKSGVAAQLSSAKQNSADNDNAANFCDATMTFGAGDKGTPGKANGTCP